MAPYLERPAGAERVRSVAVHWPRFFAASAAATVILIVSASVQWAAPMWDSLLPSLAFIGALMFLILAVGRPHAEFEVAPEGVVRREALVHRWGRRTSVIAWRDVADHAVTQELDGSRALVITARDGRTFKVWERGSGGATVDVFYDGVRRELARNRAPAGTESRALPFRPPPLTRAVVGAIGLGWLVMVVAVLAWPREHQAVRLAALAVQGVILMPLAARTLLPRRKRDGSG